ncbi:hypothetical protein HDU83_002231 [Entophlyctis luteolus]|nr:hypothetical protein HDU83_002231 [Entophlyctis luteolus]
MAPSDSLLHLLATGNAIPALESFLCGRSLGERIFTPSRHGKYADFCLDEHSVLNIMNSVEQFSQELQYINRKLLSDLDVSKEFFQWLSFVIESVSTLDKSEEIPTPDVHTGKVVSTIEKLYRADDNLRKFFEKSCSASSAGIGNTVRQGLAQAYQPMWAALESKYSTLCARDFEVMNANERPIFSIHTLGEMLNAVRLVLLPVDFIRGSLVTFKLQSVEASASIKEFKIRVNDQDFDLTLFELVAMEFIGLASSDLVVCYYQTDNKRCIIGFVEIDEERIFPSSDSADEHSSDE